MQEIKVDSNRALEQARRRKDQLLGAGVDPGHPDVQMLHDAIQVYLNKAADFMGAAQLQPPPRAGESPLSLFAFPEREQAGR